MTLRQALNEAALTRMNPEARNAYYAMINKLRSDWFKDLEEVRNGRLAEPDYPWKRVERSTRDA